MYDRIKKYFAKGIMIGSIKGKNEILMIYKTYRKGQIVMAIQQDGIHGMVPREEMHPSAAYNQY